MFFAAILSAGLIYEETVMRVYETTTIVQDWLDLVLILHIASIYLNLLSFVYANEAGDLLSFHLSVFSGSTL